MTPKQVSSAKEFYDYFIDEVNLLYQTIDESVDSLVEVWNSLVKIQGDLKQNMCLWHFESFRSEIISEHNIKIIISHYRAYYKETPNERLTKLEQIHKKIETVSSKFRDGLKSHNCSKKKCCHVCP